MRIKYQEVKEHLHRKMGSGSEQNTFMKKLQWAKSHIWEFSFLVMIQHARKMKLTCNFFFSSLPFFLFLSFLLFELSVSPTRKENAMAGMEWDTQAHRKNFSTNNLSIDKVSKIFIHRDPTSPFHIMESMEGIRGSQEGSCPEFPCQFSTSWRMTDWK